MKTKNIADKIIETVARKISQIQSGLTFEDVRQLNKRRQHLQSNAITVDGLNYFVKNISVEEQILINHNEYLYKLRFEFTGRQCEQIFSINKMFK